MLNDSPLSINLHDKKLNENGQYSHLNSKGLSNFLSCSLVCETAPFYTLVNSASLKCDNSFLNNLYYFLD